MANQLPTIVTGTAWDFVWRVKTGPPEDWSATPLTMIVRPPDQHDDAIPEMTFRHLNGGPDRSESSGGRVRFSLTPAQTLAVPPGTWLLWFAKGPLASQVFVGRGKLVVVAPGPADFAVV